MSGERAENMRILVTGGLGFIGSRVAEEHVRRGDSVAIVDRLLQQVHADDRMIHKMSSLGAEVVVGDVCDPDVWERALPGADWVYHMAAETGTGQSMHEIVRYCDANVRATALLCEALARDTSVKRVLVPSSRAIYGEGLYRCADHGTVTPNPRALADMDAARFNCTCPYCEGRVDAVATSEDARVRPSSVYAATKAAQEWLLEQTCHRLEIPVRVVRYQNVYGPGQSLKNPYTGVLAVFASRLARGEDLHVFEDGEIVRDFIYIDDVVSATLDVMELPSCDEPVNVGTGRPVTMLDVARSFARHAPSKATKYRVTGEFRFGDVRAAYAEISRLERLTGARTFVTIEEGVERLLSGTLAQ